MTSELDDKKLLGHLGRIFPESTGSASTVLDYAYAHCTPLMGLICSRVLWPEFVEFEGMVFYPSVIEDDGDRERIHSYLRKCGSRQEVEASFNRFQVVENFFWNKDGIATDDEIDELARVLAEAWKCKLSRDFPQRKFEVRMEESPEEGPFVVFSQSSA